MLIETIKKENVFRRFINFIRESKAPVRCSMAVMGLGQLIYKQWTKAIIYLTILAAMITYLIMTGVKDIMGFFTLGIIIPNPWSGEGGDDSVRMMLSGIFAMLLICLFIVVYISNVKDAASTAKDISENKKTKSFRQTLRVLVDEKFYITALAVPVVGVLVFNVIPIIFMILIAFTDYGPVRPPALLSWVGFDSFVKIFTLSEIANTFFRILLWNIVWAILSTALIYFGGIFLSLLLNKKCVKGKKFWRAFPILAYAIPGFITLIGFKFMFSQGGPINYYVELLGGSPVDFLGIGGKWWARGIGLVVVCWMSIPTQMLLMTGLLSNLNKDLFEAAQIDGAGRWKQFVKITLPFLIFATTPMLITSFIGNFNNFGIFYFLRGALPLPGYFNASDTDLLINWLYNISYEQKQYALGAALSIILFVITSVFSLTVYMRSSAYKKEDTFR